MVSQLSLNIYKIIQYWGMKHQPQIISNWNTNDMVYKLIHINKCNVIVLCITAQSIIMIKSNKGSHTGAHTDPRTPIPTTHPHAHAPHMHTHAPPDTRPLIPMHRHTHAVSMQPTFISHNVLKSGFSTRAARERIMLKRIKRWLNGLHVLLLF